MRAMDDLPGWARRGLSVMAHPWRSAFLGLIAFALILMLALALMTPRHDRDWADNVARLAEVRRAGDTISVHNYRIWSYDETGPTDTSFQTADPFEISDIAHVWFVLEPHPGVPGMAHTMIVFSSSPISACSASRWRRARKQASHMGWCMEHLTGSS